MTSRSPGGMGLGIPNGEGELLYTYINALKRSDAGTDVDQRIERIVFHDGTIWDLTGAFDITGTDAPETIYGTTYDDTPDGAGGDDIIYGASATKCCAAATTMTSCGAALARIFSKVVPEMTARASSLGVICCASTFAKPVCGASAPSPVTVLSYPIDQRRGGRLSLDAAYG